MNANGIGYLAVVEAARNEQRALAFALPVVPKTLSVARFAIWRVCVGWFFDGSLSMNPGLSALRVWWLRLSEGDYFDA